MSNSIALPEVLNVLRALEHAIDGWALITPFYVQNYQLGFAVFLYRNKDTTLTFIREFEFTNTIEDVYEDVCDWYFS